MKHFFFLLLVLFSLSCKNKEHGSMSNGASEPKAEQSGPEFTSKYICPMHCPGSGSDTIGVCPKCGMDYVLNTPKEDGHENHEGHEHDGHNHDH